MPIELQQPVQRAPITTAEIVGFTVCLRSNTLQVRLAELTAAGELVRERALSEPVPLLDANGAPRFSPQVYQSIKESIYQLLLADGIVAGNVS